MGGLIKRRSMAVVAKGWIGNRISGPGFCVMKALQMNGYQPSLVLLSRLENLCASYEWIRLKTIDTSGMAIWSKSWYVDEDKCFVPFI